MNEDELHDADKLRIEELEWTITELTFDLQACRDRVADLENQLSECDEELAQITDSGDCV